MENESEEKNENQSENIVSDTIKELCHLIMKSSDEDFLYDFFTCLFTKPELKDIANSDSVILLSGGLLFLLSLVM